MDNSWQKKWDGAWDQFKGKVKQTWSQMTDDNCDVAGASTTRWSAESRLVQVRRRKPGATG